MKFTKLAKSDKFEYMMLSRLIQDAKYFIDYPDLKHLWARTLDEHIKQMKEQYAKLDPKPEWISEEEINNLAKQMKESYTNQWNEVHPDNKIEASDNFKVGDKVFFDTLYEFQEDDLGFNYDRGILKEIKHWPSNNREYYIIQTDDGKLLQVGYVFHTEEDMEAFRNNWMNPKFEKESANDITFKVFYISDDMKKTEYKSFTDSKKAEQCAYKLFDKFKHQEPVWVERYKGNYDDGYTLLDLDPDTYDRKPIYKSYKSGYANGKKDYSVGKVFDVDDLESSWRYSKEWKEGYWQGVADAQEKEFYKQSAITQPNKPKPTTMLPDNMQWAWDPDAADWVAVLKDNTNTTPPLYDPNNQNAVNNTTTYMSNIKSASVIDGKEDEDPLSVKLSDLFLSDSSLVDSYIKKEINCDDILNILGIEIKNENEYKEVCNYVNEFINDNYMNNIKSSCLAKFLDGPQYSKEIKIEAGLIKSGLVKYAGFDFNRGTKYTITDKGLEVLKKASEKEHNEALNEKEKLAYLFGFNTDKETTLDTTGKVIKQSAKKWTICEADGTELGEVEADSELDAKIKFGIEHPEYADSQSISAKEISAQYEQTTETHEPYINPSETPNDHIVLENHDGWVNTASFEDDVRKQFQQPHQKLPNSDRDLDLLEKQILEITDEDTRDTVKKIFDKFQFSDKEAAEKRPYTEEEKRLLPLFKLVNEYVAKKQIQLTEDVQNEENVIATGQAEVINELEHKVKDLGFYCEPIAEITDNDGIGQDIYSLKIFTK